MLKKIRKPLLLVALLLFSFSACDIQDDATSANQIGEVNFSVEDLIEVEGATIPVKINMGISNYYHAKGEVKIEITGGVYGQDYISSTGSNTFTTAINAGQLVSNFSISPVNDTEVEQSVVLTIKITEVTGGLTLGEKNSVTLKLIDDDNPLVGIVSFEKETASIKENDAVATPMNFVFTQASTFGGTIAVQATGTAVYGTDYTIEGASSATFNVTVPAKANAASFKIVPINNTAFAPDKTIIFTITGVTGGLEFKSPFVSTVTIVNDDASPNALISFDPTNPATVNENAGTVTLKFLVSGTVTSAGTVELNLASGSTASGDDFKLNSPSSTLPYVLNVPVGATSATVTLPMIVVDDPTYEGNEKAILSLANTSGGISLNSGNLQYTFDILDNDADPNAFSYVETFEYGASNANNTYLTAPKPAGLGFKILATGQDAAVTAKDAEILKMNNGVDFYTNINDVKGKSDNGINVFYNATATGPGFGVANQVLVSPLMNGSGNMSVSIDLSSVSAFPQNKSIVTFYWSQTYTGGEFNEADWNVMGTENYSTVGPPAEFKRKLMSISPTAPFYVAIRVNQTVTAADYRFRWRFDNIQVKKAN
ncbi:Calx-beta domain-containing protein [Flavobacterium sp. RSSA_27]|uniref:Calx-beta domain-containing protein n=1 Tax=Flavobacterium sp. RSSA_27 TaxID=3447667 RepID=UPI003F3B7B34